LSLAAEHSLLVSVEENAVIGGAGAEVARVLEEAGSTDSSRCGWEFPIASSSTATRRCCWPTSGWTVHGIVLTV
jgi:transketolase C-terminal domain/subunit